MKKFFIISPREPTGATWLINCFLELNIKTYRNSSESMWNKQEDGLCYLNERENILKKWLPILSRKKSFRFNDNYEVEWSHSWPTKYNKNHMIIYFIRDPRDSLYSRYKRENPDVSFEEFLNIPDSKTLLDKIDNWVLFNRYWLKYSYLKVFRFEDYKTNPKELLLKILDYIDVRFSLDKVNTAIQESDFHKAKIAHDDYIKNNPEESEITVRKSEMGEWINNDNIKRSIKLIEHKACDLIKFFGYKINDNIAQNATNYYPNFLIQPLFATLLYRPDEILENEEMKIHYKNLNYLLNFIDNLPDSWLEKLGKYNNEGEKILKSITYYFNCLESLMINKIVNVINEYEPKKTNDYLLYHLECFYKQRKISDSFFLGFAVNNYVIKIKFRINKWKKALKTKFFG